MKHTFLGKPPVEENVYRTPDHYEEPSLLYSSSGIKTKEILDFSLAVLCLLLICWWLFPIIGFFIKTSSKGPVFFKQLRHGKDDVPFYCYKFRTMVPNENADILQAKKGDDRVTKIGAFLRKSSLDELPQLINVLRGEMSIVGPRPHSVPMNEIFSKEIPDYMSRHALKPGITGLAQSKGLRGEIADFHDLSSRYKLDIFYLKNRSLTLDVKIIFWTAHSMVFKNTKAY